MIGCLTASFSDLQLAEDALQEAAEIACRQWAEKGLPASPAGWLMTTARRRAIDQLRRQKRFHELVPELQYQLTQAAQGQDPFDSVVSDQSIPDKRLELIFCCCHPALDMKTRVALTLRTLGGLETAQIARAFMVGTPAMAQRLVRARHKLSAAGVAWQVPAAEHLQERLAGVLAVIYFVFNEGYRSSCGPALMQRSLSEEAIRLGRMLHQLMPESCEVMGLLSLMLLHDSRRESRLAEDGSLIALQSQNRKRWDRQRMHEGRELLEGALRQGQAGPYQIQAAISAVHADAVTWESTDWHQIVALYEVLHHMQPGPVVRLNQAVAVSHAQSAQQALSRLDVLAMDKRLQDYQPYHVALADLRYRAGLVDAAIDSMHRALSLTQSVQERRFLESRLQSMQLQAS